MARTYAETPNSTSEVNGSDILVVQQGNGTGSAGFPQMKKTTLSVIKEYMTDGIASAIVFKGSLTWSQLQALTGMKVGDMYNVTDRDGQNYAWTGSQWDALGETKDLSGIEERLAAEEEATGRLTSALTDLSEDTYRKAEVDEKVAEATPSDYEALKREVREQNYRLDNLETVGDHMTYSEPTENGVLEMPSSVTVAPYSEVEELRGKTEAYTEVDLGTVSWTQAGSGTTDRFVSNISAKGIPQSEVTSASCPRYASGRWADLFVDGKDRYICVNESGVLCIRDTSFNGNASAFKTAMAGVILRYDGTANTLHDASVTGVRSVGRNLWDEEWEIGSINHSTGAKMDNANRLRSKNYIPVSGSRMYITSTLCNCIFYDGSYNVVGGVYNQKSLTVPANAKYMMFHTDDEYGKVYNHDIAIFEGAEEREYEPYQSSLLPLNITLKEGDTYYPAEGKVQPTMRKVDLGSLDYTQTPYGFYASLDTKSKIDGSNDAIGNLIVAGYETTSYNILTSLQKDKCISYRDTNSSGGSGIAIRNTAYTSASALKTAMTGVELLYEPATPPEPIPAPSVSPFIKVEAGGTVSVLSDGSQAEATIKFQTKKEATT